MHLQALWAQECNHFGRQGLLCLFHGKKCVFPLESSSTSGVDWIDLTTGNWHTQWSPVQVKSELLLRDQSTEQRN